MLFKKLFIATLAALALVGCNDDNDIDNPALTEAGDVNVVFATSSSEQAVTKSDGSSTNVYPNFTPTDEVYEYCLKKKVNDPEFVINHMTVFVFDAKSGGLVKTAYFKDVLNGKKGSSMKLPETEEEANSICEFGGIVLKAGTYNFILAGNLTKEQIKADAETFDDYKNAAITWEDEDENKCISSQIANTYLPMVKVLTDVKLIAHERTANATLNFIGNDEGRLKIEAPEEVADDNALSPPSAIQLTRLVARIQLKSLAFNWTVAGGVETPAASITLKKVYLANASNKSVLTGDNEGDGYVHGFTVTKDMFFQNGTADVDNLSKELEYDRIIENGKPGIEWGSTEDAGEDTDRLPLSFYAFGKTINAKNNDSNLTMVLECSAAYAGSVAPEESVFYYVPIVQKGIINSIVANNVYNVSVTLIGQGSDENGKKYDKPTVNFEWTFDKWNEPQKIEIGGIPVQNN